jgi:FtsZ-interacting cell division protein ZipA
MDLNTITIILAIITIVPTVGGLMLQARREKKQAEMDERKAKAQEETDRANAAAGAASVASVASSNIIITLQGEVDRLNKRLAELELAVIDKTTRIGELMLAKIDGEAEVATMKYKMDTMQLKLNAILPEESVKPRKKKEDIQLKQTLLSLEEKKTKIAQETSLEIEKLKNNSITNGIGE